MGALVHLVAGWLRGPESGETCHVRPLADAGDGIPGPRKHASPDIHFM